MPRQLLALVLLAALAGCGDGDPGATTSVVTAAQAPTSTAAPATTAAPEPVPRASEAIVHAWSEAINRNDNASAGRLFAPGAIVVQSSTYRLDTPESAVVWNDGLPCAGRVVDVRMYQEAVIATFELGQRPGHRCNADPGKRASAAFVIANGLIRLWQQVPVPDDLAPAAGTSTGVGISA